MDLVCEDILKWKYVVAAEKVILLLIAIKRAARQILRVVCLSQRYVDLV